MIQLGEMPELVITFVVIAIIIGIGATIITNVQTGQTANSYAYNASARGLEGIDKISQWQPTLAIIVVAAVVIGVIGMFYMARR